MTRPLSTRQPNHCPHPYRTTASLNALPLAIYRPASLFILLVFASVTKNTFSLRWLSLNAYDGSCYYGSYRYDGQCLKALSNDLEILDSVPTTAQDNARKRQQEILNLGISEETYNKLLSSIPRGGEQNSPTANSSEQTYVGLINLGNTCYLNAQLQCAFHVPAVRELVLAAKDKIVEIEVEDDEECDVEENEVVDEDLQTTIGAAATEAEHDDNDNQITSSEPEVSTISDAKTEQRTKPKTTQQIQPITPALQALQQTFLSLSSRHTGGTQSLCRSLGINPYIQQDGQEFWKLFLPELQSEEIMELYRGSYEDYIREIVENDGDDLSEDREEKKEEENFVERSEKRIPRERVRSDPFLDLSIPVTEGVG